LVQLDDTTINRKELGCRTSLSITLRLAAALKQTDLWQRVQDVGIPHE
jgi:hypothetical protein